MLTPNAIDAPDEIQAALGALAVTSNKPTLAVLLEQVGAPATA
jgi:hypothetical protein